MISPVPEPKGPRVRMSLQWRGSGSVREACKAGWCGGMRNRVLIVEITERTLKRRLVMEKR
jgi:hypothetical protein